MKQICRNCKWCEFAKVVLEDQRTVFCSLCLRDFRMDSNHVLSNAHGFFNNVYPNDGACKDYERKGNK